MMTVPKIKPEQLLKFLGTEVAAGSGAMGSCLHALESLSGACVEQLNLNAPAAVTAIHLDYIHAGAQVLVTNTFAGNSIRLSDAGLAEDLEGINRSGVRLARQALAESASELPVFASIGPLGLGLRLEDYTDSQLRRIFAEQAAALAAADVLLLETFIEQREARAAVEAAAAAALPFIFQVGPVPGDQTARRLRIQHMVKFAEQAGALAVGVNCQHPGQALETVKIISACTELPITASPNAGTPHIERGAVCYDLTPSGLAQAGIALAQAGVALVGGCCGTSPAHIAELAAALRGRAVIPRQETVYVASAPAAAGPRPEKAAAENRVRRLMRGDKFLVSVEIRAERRQTLAEVLDGAACIAAAGADLFDVPDNPGATVGRDTMITASTLQNALDIPCISHKAATHSNLLQLHSYLIGCWDSGLQGVLAVTGDPPSVGHLAGSAQRVTDVRSSVELLRLIARLRRGELITGEALAGAPDFCAGCAVGSAANVLAGQTRWLARKVDAGAEFAFSQPVFSLEQFRHLRDAAATCNIRLFPGILPLVSRRNAEFLAGGRIPGIDIPQDLLEAFTELAKLEDQKRFGLEKAADLALELRREAAGIYLIMPFGKDCYEQTAAIVRQIKNV